MANKSKSKSKDTTPELVKNTQTGVKDQGEVSLRWYHIVATVVVLGLVIIAVIRIFSRFDTSLINSQYTVKYTTGCTTSIAGPVEKEKIPTFYRYAGIKEGDMLGADGPTKNEGEAFVKIVELGSSKVIIKTRNAADGVWSEKSIRYGVETTTVTEEAPDCMPGITFTINR